VLLPLACALAGCGILAPTPDASDDWWPETFTQEENHRPTLAKLRLTQSSASTFHFVLDGGPLIQGDASINPTAPSTANWYGPDGCTIEFRRHAIGVAIQTNGQCTTDSIATLEGLYIVGDGMSADCPGMDVSRDDVERNRTGRCRGLVSVDDTGSISLKNRFGESKLWCGSSCDRVSLGRRSGVELDLSWSAQDVWVNEAESHLPVAAVSWTPDPAWVVDPPGWDACPGQATQFACRIKESARSIGLCVEADDEQEFLSLRMWDRPPGEQPPDVLVGPRFPELRGPTFHRTITHEGTEERTRLSVDHQGTNYELVTEVELEHREFHRSDPGRVTIHPPGGKADTLHCEPGWQGSLSGFENDRFVNVGVQ
jgi:hypothetical protein